MLPRVTATITIDETGEKTETEFVNVTEMLMNVMDNIGLAQIAFGRSIAMQPPVFEGDHLRLVFNYVGDQSLYMTVDAIRHFTH